MRLMRTIEKDTAVMGRRGGTQGLRRSFSKEPLSKCDAQDTPTGTRGKIR